MGSPRQNVNCGSSNSKYACVFVRDIIIWLTIEDCWESSASSPSLLHYELTRNIQNKNQRVLTKPMNFADTKSISKEKHQTLRTIQTCCHSRICAMLYEKKDPVHSFEHQKLNQSSYLQHWVTIVPASTLFRSSCAGEHTPNRILTMLLTFSQRNSLLVKKISFLSVASLWKNDFWKKNVVF